MLNCKSIKFSKKNPIFKHTQKKTVLGKVALGDKELKVLWIRHTISLLYLLSYFKNEVVGILKHWF